MLMEQQENYDMMDLQKSPLQNQQKGMSIKDFTLINIIGKGSFAQVILAKKNDTGKVYAIKKLKKKQLQKKRQVGHVMAQRRAMSHFNHPFIIKLHYSFRSQKCLFFVMEYCACGELFTLLQKKKKLTQDQTRFYAAQIVLALQHIHERKIIYRDLKPQNVVLDTQGYIRLTDFGLCKQEVVEDNQAKSICGTPQYMAPQILYKQGHGRPVDWWCLGSIIYQMMNGLPPFYTMNKSQLFDKIKFSNPNFPTHFSKNLKNLLEGLFAKKPAQRLGSKGAQEIKKHPWFVNIDWNDVLNKKLKAPYVPVLKGQDDLSCFDGQFTRLQISNSFDGSIGSSDSKKFFGFDYEGSPQFEMQKTEEN